MNKKALVSAIILVVLGLVINFLITATSEEGSKPAITREVAGEIPQK